MTKGILGFRVTNVIKTRLGLASVRCDRMEATTNHPKVVGSLIRIDFELISRYLNCAGEREYEVAGHNSTVVHHDLTPYSVVTSLDGVAGVNLDSMGF